jgi:hypothetical protein
MGGKVFDMGRDLGHPEIGPKFGVSDLGRYVFPTREIRLKDIEYVAEDGEKVTLKDVRAKYVSRDRVECTFRVDPAHIHRIFPTVRTITLPLGGQESDGGEKA